MSAPVSSAGGGITEPVCTVRGACEAGLLTDGPVRGEDTGMIAMKSRWPLVRAVLLASVLGAMAAGQAGAQGAERGAETGAEKALLDEARAATSDGRYVDALAVYATAIAAAPADASVHAQRAQLLVVLGQADLAALDYREAVKLKPEDAGLQANLCLNLALANHDLDGALGACEAAVRLEPTNYEALSARGYVQLRRGAWAAAETDFLAALALNPASPNELFGHGLAVIKLGRAQEGRDEIASATLDSAGLVSIWGARGFGARGEIRPGKAETKAGQALISGNEFKLLSNTGEAFVSLSVKRACGRFVPAMSAAQWAPVMADSGNFNWSGACRFGLVHGEGRLVASSGEEGPVVRYAYGREIAVGAAGEALERKLTLAYQAAERALQP